MSSPSTATSAVRPCAHRHVVAEASLELEVLGLLRGRDHDLDRAAADLRFELVLNSLEQDAENRQAIDHQQRFARQPSRCHSRSDQDADRHAVTATCLREACDSSIA
jgi:hypothetical protein